MPEPFEIAFLGTGSPLGGDRCGNGQVVIAGAERVMVDCGWGSARRLLAAGVPAQSVDIAVFTHMHTDHITDVPDFLFLRWTGGATTPLRVFGPEGTKETMDGFLMALRRDIGYRQAHHGDKLHPDGIKVEVTEVPATKEPQEVLRAGGLRIESFEVDHFPVVPAFGYRAMFDGRTAVISGDTSYCDTLARASEGADMLVCEALNLAQVDRIIAALTAAGRTREAGLLSDVPSYHIGTLDVARLAKEAGVGELVLTHLVPPTAAQDVAEQAFVAGMSEVYPGSIRVARDTRRLPVTKRGA